MIAAFIVPPENKKGGENMKDIWAYNPDVCDGGPCVLDCDFCSRREEALEAAEAEAEEGESEDLH